MDKSKFKVGDKVRVISEVLKNVYMPNEHEIITAIDETRGITENRIMLAYPLNDKLEDDDGYYWKDGDLIHYGESPLNQEAETLHAEIERLKAENAKLKELFHAIELKVMLIADSGSVMAVHTQSTRVISDTFLGMSITAKEILAKISEADNA